MSKARQTANKWIAVAAALDKDPTKSVLCPFCENATLTVTDVP
jgi:hypothetical protein